MFHYRRILAASLFWCWACSCLRCPAQSETAVPTLSNREARKLASRIVEAAAPAGTVQTEFTVRAFVGVDGKVKDVVNSNALPDPLFSAASAAAREWWFRDYLPDGKPSAFQVDITFHGPVAGTVTTADGKPVPEVWISGSGWKCCPAQRDTATTTASGAFRIERPGAAIHVDPGEQFRPLTLVVKPDISTLSVTLQASTNNLLPRLCEKPARNTQRLGEGKAGLHFDVPLRSTKLIRGKTDVDYVHVVKPNEGDGRLAFWFGPYAMNSTSEDEQFLKSAAFDQRYVVASKDLFAPGKAGVVGLDCRGRLPNGNMWRRMAVPGDGAIYDDVEPQTAALVDQVIDSLCWVPYPR